jgi:hypothetical protein
MVKKVGFRRKISSFAPVHHQKFVLNQKFRIFLLHIAQKIRKKSPLERAPARKFGFKEKSQVFVGF